MRCIFTMFAEDVDLLPKGRSRACCRIASLRQKPSCRSSKSSGPRWISRRTSGFFSALPYASEALQRKSVRRALGRSRLVAKRSANCCEAAKAKWTEVDPAIFGTLLEQALDPGSAKSSARTTHRAPMSQRLVDATVMEPLREDWQKALDQGRGRLRSEATTTRRRRSCAASTTSSARPRVLDPACGTGNFLYVSAGTDEGARRRGPGDAWPTSAPRRASSWNATRSTRTSSSGWN